MKPYIVKFLIPLKVKRIILRSKTRENINQLSKQQKILMYTLLRNKYLTYSKATILSRYYKKLPKGLKPILGGYKFNKFLEKTIKIIK